MKENNWIDVNDKLPKDQTTVKAKFENGDINEDVMFWNEEEGFDGYAEPLHIMVTHWQPIKD